QSRLSPNDMLMVKSAYLFSKFGHRSQYRIETDSDGNALKYFEHVRRTAIILIDELNIYDPEMVAAAVLHDSFEDTKDITPELVEFSFGNRVTRMVKCLTNIPKVGYYDRLKTSGDDVLTIKLCDRLDNTRSLTHEAVNEAFKKRKSLETIKVYIPMFTEAFFEHQKKKKL